MEKKSAVLGATATLIAGSLFFGLNSVQASEATPQSHAASAAEIRQDAWANFSDGVANKDEAAIGFNATYIGSYTSEPHMGADFVVEKSSAYQTLWHVFTVSRGN